MVGRERNPDIRQSDLMSEEVDEIGQLAIEIEDHLLHFAGVWPDLVAKNVSGRQADRK